MLFDKSEIDGFLLDKKASKDELALKRSEFLAWLSELKTELKAQISPEVTLPSEQKAQRIARGENDYLYFAKTYFSHYFSIATDCELHTYLASVFQNISKNEKGLKYAIAAPRGYAKTTHSCVIFVLWLICYAKKHFIVQISDAIELALTNLEAIKVELEANANLKADFPQSCGEGRIWKVGELVSKNGIKVKAFGSSKRLRGVKHGVYRPDVAIIDDLENDTNVRSKEQRDKLEDWLDEAVLNLGSIDGKLSVLYIGTILHTDSVLARKLKLSFWHPRLFKAIKSFPVRLDLWDEYSKIYKTQGQDGARSFYLANKSLMDEGASVLWQEASDIEALMQKRAENLKAFNKEQLNTPLSDTQKFRLEDMHFYTALPRFDYKILYADPAGSSKKSDFTSITILGINKELCKCYVIESLNEIMSARAIISKICDFQLTHRCKIVAVETNGGQFFLKNWLNEEAFNRQIYMPLRGVHNRASKSERIEELELPIANGEIMLHKSQSILIEQLLFYPEANHDDAPDSLAGAYALSKLKRKKKKRSRFLTPRRREY